MKYLSFTKKYKSYNPNKKLCIVDISNRFLPDFDNCKKNENQTQNIQNV